MTGSALRSSTAKRSFSPQEKRAALCFSLPSPSCRAAARGDLRSTADKLSMRYPIDSALLHSSAAQRALNVNR